jgi:hypothetical protein
MQPVAKDEEAMEAVMLAEPGHANTNLIRVVRYYSAMTGGKPMPHRDCFQPIDLHWLFGHFYTVDILNGGADYRFGYSGPFWSVIYGIDLSGRRMSEMDNLLFAQDLRALYDPVVAQRRPGYYRCRLSWQNGRYIAHERVTIPFAGDDGLPSMLLVAAQYDRKISEVLCSKGCGLPRLEICETGYLDAA